VPDQKPRISFGQILKISFEQILKISFEQIFEKSFEHFLFEQICAYLCPLGTFST